MTDIFVGICYFLALFIMFAMKDYIDKLRKENRKLNQIILDIRKELDKLTDND